MESKEYRGFERQVSPSDDSFTQDAGKHRIDDTAVFAAAAADITWTPQEERRVVMKIDAVILTLLLFGAIVSYADTQAYGFAALFGLVIDLDLYSFGPAGLDTSKYSFSASIYQLGSLAGQYPLLLLAQHLPNGRFLAATQIYTGMCALLTIVCHNYSQILALRFFWGFGSIASAMSVIITSMWWKTNEQPLRIGIFISGSALGNLIGQAIDLGAINIKGAFEGPNSQWKWIYVILGAATMGYAVIAICFFSSSPMKAWFLNDRERMIAVRRLVQNNTGIQTRAFKSYQILDLIKDPQLYLIGIFSFGYAFVNNATGSFFGFLVSSFGYSNREAIVLSMPASAIAIVSMVASGVIGSTFPRWRILNAVFWILPSIAGSAMLWKGEGVHVLLAGLYLSQTFYGALVQQFALVAANVGGHTKKTLFNATIVILGNLGSFSGPFAYHGNQAAEHYPTGQQSSLSLLTVSCASFLVLWGYYVWRNNQKKTFREQHPELVEEVRNSLVDHTDKENPVFQYVT